MSQACRVLPPPTKAEEAPVAEVKTATNFRKPMYSTFTHVRTSIPAPPVDSFKCPPAPGPTSTLSPLPLTPTLVSASPVVYGSPAPTSPFATGPPTTPRFEASMPGSVLPIEDVISARMRKEIAPPPVCPRISGPPTPAMTPTTPCLSAANPQLSHSRVPSSNSAPVYLRPPNQFSQPPANLPESIPTNVAPQHHNFGPPQYAHPPQPQLGGYPTGPPGPAPPLVPAYDTNRGYYNQQPQYSGSRPSGLEVHEKRGVFSSVFSWFGRG